MSEHTEQFNEPTLGLLVRNATTTFEVLSHTRGSKIPGGVRLRGPVLGTPEGDARPIGSVEIVTRLVNADGGVLETFGWSDTSLDFFDWMDDDRNLKGFTVSSPDATRSFCFPVRSGAEFVVVSKAELVATPGGKAVRETPLRVIRLMDGGTGGGPRFPLPEDPRTGGSLEVTNLEFRMIVGSIPIGFTPSPGGYIDGVTSLHPGHRPFDIVITGDGFAESDKQTFLDEAAVVINGLRDMEPFKTLDAHINYHTVVAISQDSGITDPGNNVVKTTYYHSTTGWAGGYRWNVGTFFPGLIKDAASLVRPWSDVDVVLVIANINEWGGYAMRKNGTAFICRRRPGTAAVIDTDLEFTHLAAHESGHVVAKLGDEYYQCTKYTEFGQRPNTATELQVRTGDVPWKKLLVARGEANVDGSPKFVHDYHAGCDQNNDDGHIASTDAGRLGAFWGCMYSDPARALTEPCTEYDSRGFYRPMKDCVMRRASLEFCQVCRKEYSDAIWRGVEWPILRGAFLDGLPIHPPRPADIIMRRFRWDPGLPPGPVVPPPVPPTP